MLIALIIFAACTFALLTWVILKIGELDERQEELDEYSLRLDELANKLAQWEQELTQWDKEEKQ